MAAKIDELEARVVRLEGLLSSFASMVSRSPSEVRRIGDAVETRMQEDRPVEAVISLDGRTRVAGKAISMMANGVELPHATLTRAVRGTADGRQVSAVMAWLAEQGYVRIIREEKAEGGRPTTIYRLIETKIP